METPAIVVLAFVLAAMGSGWLIFDGVRMARPALGVISLADTMVMLGAVVLAPLVYLHAPTTLVAGLFLLAAASSLHALGSAVFHSRWTVWSTVGVVLAADVICAVRLGPHHPAFWIVNDSVLVALTGSVGAFWVQGGLRARDATVLTLSIAVYDLVATGVLPLTEQVLARVTSMPMAPLVGWGPVSVGLGDLLIATMVPLAYRKAFGVSAGLTAMSTGLLVIAVALVVHISGPLMVWLGPPLAAQYVVWRCWTGPERTRREYLMRHNAGPVIGSMLDYGVAPSDPERVISIVIDCATRIVSLIVTGDGYNADDKVGLIHRDPPPAFKTMRTARRRHRGPPLAACAKRGPAEVQKCRVQPLLSLVDMPLPKGTAGEPNRHGERQVSRVAMLQEASDEAVVCTPCNGMVEIEQLTPDRGWAEAIGSERLACCPATRPFIVTSECLTHRRGKITVIQGYGPTCTGSADLRDQVDIGADQDRHAAGQCLGGRQAEVFLIRSQRKQTGALEGRYPVLTPEPASEQHPLGASTIGD